MKLDLVYNPVSGNFSQARLRALVRAFERGGAQVRLQPSARDWSPGPNGTDLVCVHGGDGTLRDLVQALGPLAAGMPLCIAPSGTINLVARELGYARQPERLAEQVCAAWERGPQGWLRAPLFCLGEMPIVACLSIGPDSHAVAGVSSALKRRIGRFAYVVALARQLRRWPRAAMDVTGELDDGTAFACEAEAAVASHGAFYAGSFRLSPRAALAANSFELITLTRSTRFGMLMLTLAAMLRLPLDRLGLAEIRTCRRVTFDRCVSPVQVDGDHMPGCAYAIGPSGMSLTYVV
ncbi:MAG: diacylglycerol/lipid kinase family protein [Tsuneonella sp.]